LRFNSNCSPRKDKENEKQAFLFGCSLGSPLPFGAAFAATAKATAAVDQLVSINVVRGPVVLLINAQDVEDCTYS